MATLTPASFQRRLIQLQGYPEKVGDKAVKLNAENGRDNAFSQVRSDTNGKAALRNTGKLLRSNGFVVGRAGSPLSASIQVKKAGTNPGTFVSATGPWQIINNPSVSHIISPAGLERVVLAGPTLDGRRLRSKSGRDTAKGRVGRATVLRTPYGPRRWVRHPGTKGKQSWQKALAKTEAEAPAILKQVAEDELGKIVR